MSTIRVCQLNIHLLCNDFFSLIDWLIDCEWKWLSSSMSAPSSYEFWLFVLCSFASQPVSQSPVQRYNSINICSLETYSMFSRINNNKNNLLQNISRTYYYYLFRFEIFVPCIDGLGESGENVSECVYASFEYLHLTVVHTLYAPWFTSPITATTIPTQK